MCSRSHNVSPISIEFRMNIRFCNSLEKMNGPNIPNICTLIRGGGVPKIF